MPDSEIDGSDCEWGGIQFQCAGKEASDEESSDRTLLLGKDEHSASDSDTSASESL